MNHWDLRARAGAGAWAIGVALPNRGVVVRSHDRPLPGMAPSSVHAAEDGCDGAQKHGKERPERRRGGVIGGLLDPGRRRRRHRGDVGRRTIQRRKRHVADGLIRRQVRRALHSLRRLVSRGGGGRGGAAHQGRAGHDDRDHEGKRPDGQPVKRAAVMILVFGGATGDRAADEEGYGVGDSHPHAGGDGELVGVAEVELVGVERSRAQGHPQSVEHGANCNRHDHARKNSRPGHQCMERVMKCSSRRPKVCHGFAPNAFLMRTQQRRFSPVPRSNYWHADHGVGARTSPLPALGPRPGEFHASGWPACRFEALMWPHPWARRPAMRDIVDLPGASGDLYRFRRAVEPNYTAGNFAVLRDLGDSYEVVCIGHTTSLVSAPWSDVAARRDLVLYLRLNVAQRIRLSEHEDLRARWPEAQVLSDEVI